VAEYLPTEPYRGTRDFLPADMSVRTQVFHRLYNVVESYGYQAYDTPILEPVEIYESKTSQEIVDEQLYTLTDKGGRRLALRPEMTPSVARMLANNIGKVQFPVRWYSHPNCHRYERPQKGRLREHWQLNVDLFGSASPAVEIEFIDLIHDMMAALGATGDMYTLRMSDRVLLNSMLSELVELPDELLAPTARLLDRWNKESTQKLATEAAEIGLSEKQFERLGEVVRSGAEVLSELSPQAREASMLLRILDTEAGDRIVFDPLIVRGFDYYTSTVFEVFDADPQNRRSLFGGGRYDNLVGLFSAQEVAGFGFGMGDVTLMDFLRTHGLLPEPDTGSQVVVIPTEDALFDPGRQAAREIRRAGWSATLPLETRKLGKEIGRADKAGARAVVIVGREDWETGVVTVRDMGTGEQHRSGLDSLAETVRGVLAPTTP